MNLRWLVVWKRNFRVWLKLFGPAMLGNFGEPLLYLLALGYGLGAFVGEINGQPYHLFLAAGIVAASTMNTATFEGLYSAYTRMMVQQTWFGMLSGPLSVRDILLGEMVWGATKSLISAVSILLVAVLLGMVDSWMALMVLPVVFLLGLCFCALALVVTAVSPGYDFFLYYITLCVTPMFLLSGVFFPLDQMPPWLQMGAQWLPLSHGVELVRPLVNGVVPGEIFAHIAVLLVYIAGAFIVAERLVARRLLN